jgi:hypothetical protein
MQSGGTLWLVGINTFTAAGSSGTAGSTFGNLGGGMLLSDTRFINWMTLTTQGTLGTQPSGDVPLPAWALGSLALGLMTRIGRTGRIGRIGRTSQIGSKGRTA